MFTICGWNDLYSKVCLFTIIIKAKWYNKKMYAEKGVLKINYAFN